MHIFCSSTHFPSIPPTCPRCTSKTGKNIYIHAHLPTDKHIGEYTCIYRYYHLHYVTSIDYKFELSPCGFRIPFTLYAQLPCCATSEEPYAVLNGVCLTHVVCERVMRLHICVCMCMNVYACGETTFPLLCWYQKSRYINNG